MKIISRLFLLLIVLNSCQPAKSDEELSLEAQAYRNDLQNAIIPLRDSFKALLAEFKYLTLEVVDQNKDQVNFASLENKYKHTLVTLAECRKKVEATPDFNSDIQLERSYFNYLDTYERLLRNDKRRIIDYYKGTITDTDIEEVKPLLKEFILMAEAANQAFVQEHRKFASKYGFVIEEDLPTHITEDSYAQDAKADNNQQIIPKFSNTNDTIRNGDIFRTKVYVSNSHLFDVAKRNGIQEYLLVEYSTKGENYEKMSYRKSGVQANMLGDTALIEIMVQVDTLKAGEVANYPWTVVMKFNYTRRFEGVDSTFIISNTLKVIQ